MPIDNDTSFYLAVKDAVLRKNPIQSVRRNALNHLILGDALGALLETKGGWGKFNCRRSEGWLKMEWVTENRMLEVNFVDIGQGDGCHIVTPENEVLLIDAGEGVGFDGKGGDNMLRFLSWRYNLRHRKVGGVEGIAEDDPEAKSRLKIDYAIISHPDLDHYYGFYSLFSHPKLTIKKIGHNGIVERSIKDGSSSTWMYDLGRKIPPLPYKRKYHLWDTVLTHNEFIAILDSQPKSTKFYLKTMLAARKNNPNVEFVFLDRSKEYLDHFDTDNKLSIEILAPITEEMTYKNETRQCLLKLGNESKTKNGHSVVFKLEIGKLKMLLGGDLNEKSQDYLAAHYSGISTKMSKLEKDIRKNEQKLSGKTNLSTTIKENLEEELKEDRTLLETIISRTKVVFGVDIAKACHHGSSDILDSFLHSIHPIATVISSGDNESYSHPRPDALGAYGKSGRGARPLIFSTELARSTNEFSYPFKFYTVLKKMEERMNALTRPADKEIYRLRMENLRDSNVARYGMITVRTDGEKVIIAQKLEKNKGNAKKWDIYELVWNDKLHSYETVR